MGPVLSGSHVSGFGWEQLLCCQFLYEAERPPRPFAFLPTLPHPFAIIALSPSFCHRPYRPEPRPPLVAGRRMAPTRSLADLPEEMLIHVAPLRRGLVREPHGRSPSPPGRLLSQERQGVRRGAGAPQPQPEAGAAAVG